MPYLLARQDRGWLRRYSVVVVGKRHSTRSKIHFPTFQPLSWRMYQYGYSTQVTSCVGMVEAPKSKSNKKEKRYSVLPASLLPATWTAPPHRAESASHKRKKTLVPPSNHLLAFPRPPLLNTANQSLLFLLHSTQQGRGEKKP